MGLPRAERPQDSQELTEPSTGVKLTFTLQAGGWTEGAMARENARKVAEDYLTGAGDRPAGPFPDPSIKLSWDLILNAAQLAEMQVGTEFSTLDFIILADRCPVIYAGLMEMSARLNQAWGRVEGNSPGAPSA